MNKLILLTVVSTLSMGAWASPEYKAVATCQFDYDDFEYCSKSNIAKYKQALKTSKPNFDTNYILLNLSKKTNSFRYVAIDSRDGLVFPLNDEIIGFKDNKGGLTGKPPIISYSVNNPYLCIKGSVDSYRNSYDNVKVCYSIQKDEYSTYGKDFIRVDSPESLED
ncbi:hypothetical protein [Acinetobacter radioresistens]|uniref:hypothetical protein n=1 Tax=Acinetobacter radioresistens TaxID=40216 RepID=UPI000E72A8E7|nr:hypothetical protein [Acinetobacter radioresistens]RJL71636.1 hypothetical protein D5055_08295 [Acinetobacter radioresistens]